MNRTECLFFFDLLSIIDEENRAFTTNNGDFGKKVSISTTICLPRPSFIIYAYGMPVTIYIYINSLIKKYVANRIFIYAPMLNYF